jgi:hypothetical protein
MMLLAGIGQIHAYQERVLSLLIVISSLFSDTEPRTFFVSGNGKQGFSSLWRSIFLT